MPAIPRLPPTAAELLSAHQLTRLGMQSCRPRTACKTLDSKLLHDLPTSAPWATSRVDMMTVYGGAQYYWDTYARHRGCGSSTHAALVSLSASVTLTWRVRMHDIVEQKSAMTSLVTFEKARNL